MQEKNLAPFFTLVTLLFECGLAVALWEMDGNLSGGPNFRPTLDILWPFFLAFNLAVLPLIVLTMTRREGPVLSSLRARPTSRYHLAIYRYPMGFYLAMGFCMPSLVGDPLMSGLSYGVSSALLPVFLIFLVAVAFGRYFEPTIDTLHRWAFHWTGRLFIGMSVAAYLLASILIMYALRQQPGHLPYVLGTFFGAYLPLRVYLHYLGRGSFTGVVLIVLGLGWQQYLLWT